MNKKISDKDLKDWETFLSNNENLPDKDSNSAKREKIKTYTFDLHGFSLEDANKKIGETMTIPMKEEDAIQWFGALPPDLSLTARSKGADYIYAKLNTYYEDDNSATGYNNIAYPNTSMPHILADLQGGQKLVLDSKNNPVSFSKTSEGSFSDDEYRQLTNDITNFLVYVSEPAKLKRQSIGFWVLMFLFIFTILAYYTKKEFWKDVH